MTGGFSFLAVEFIKSVKDFLFGGAQLKVKFGEFSEAGCSDLRCFHVLDEAVVLSFAFEHLLHISTRNALLNAYFQKNFDLS